MDDSERLDRVCAALGVDRAEIESLPEMVKVVGYDGAFIGFYHPGRVTLAPYSAVFEVIGTVEEVLAREFRNREYWRETMAYEATRKGKDAIATDGE